MRIQMFSFFISEMLVITFLHLFTTSKHFRFSYTVVPTQVEKMRAKLANLNHCAVPFLSRAAVNLSWYDITVFYTYYNGYLFLMVLQFSYQFSMYKNTML